MTRVLQIRRGTTEQNDNFTGMIGEITMDTDAKTLRVHDGETLGGYELARKDTATSTGNCDISSISDEQWTEIFNKYSPAPFVVTETRPVPINSRCSFVDYIIGDADKPKFVQVALICQSDDAGYSVGDEVWAFGIGNRTNPMPNIKFDDSGMHVCLMVGQEQYWVNHRDTGVVTTLDDEKWCVLFRLYC